MPNSQNQFCGFIKSFSAFSRVPGQGSSGEQLVDIFDNDLHSKWKKQKTKAAIDKICSNLIRAFFFRQQFVVAVLTHLPSSPWNNLPDIRIRREEEMEKIREYSSRFCLEVFLFVCVLLLLGFFFRKNQWLRNLRDSDGNTAKIKCSLLRICYQNLKM